MKNKMIPFIIVLLSLGIVLTFLIVDNNTIPKDFIAVFHGEHNETYIYKLNNDHANMGFKYINVTNEKISDKGEVTWTDDVFYVAKNNDAYDYVIVPGDNKKYTIEEFMGKFIMN